MPIMSKLLVLSTALIALTSSQTTFTYNQQTQQDCLDWHNAERSQTAQGNEYCSSGSGVWDTTCPAGTIQKLKWDSGLASAAQEWAETLANDDCAWGHSTNDWREGKVEAATTAFSYPSGDWVGENIARSGNTGGYPTGEDIYNNWNDRESGLFKYGSSTVQSSGGSYGSNPTTGETGNGQIGHYTQVVAHRSEYLGCGFAGNRCYNADYDRWFYYSYTVCMYYPGGNYGSGSREPYADDGACNSCDSGSTCNSGTNYLCDDGGSDVFDTPVPTANTPSPTKRPTPQTVTEEPPDNGGSGGSCSSITVSGTNYSPFDADYNCQSASNDLGISSVDHDNVYGPVYVPFNGQNAYWFYREWRSSRDGQNKFRWLLGSSIGALSYFMYCDCGNSVCEITSCNNFYDWTDSYTNPQSGISVRSTTAAYSSSSSSNKNKNDLIEGLLIGLGIAIGVFLLSLLIYWCVKRRNSKKNEFTVVEMNNEISNHEYVTMNN